jgi:DNA-binding CsgD family transcriptional regulator
VIDAMRARGAGPGVEPPRPTFGLTPRELQIVSSVVHGLANGDIALRFSISVKTVKHHLTNIFDKVGVSNRLELALFAVQHRLESGPPAQGPRPHQTPSRALMNADLVAAANTGRHAFIDNRDI